MIKNIKWLFLVSLTFVACNNDDEVTTVPNSSDGLPLTAGTADFTKYVALGNSLTAGFSDNALFIEGQKGSYTNILAQQFAQVGGGEFKIPFMNDNVGGLLFGGMQIQGARLYFNGTAPVPVTGTPTTEVTTKLTGAFNNLGVPGAKSYHLLAAGYGNPAGVPLGQANPYYARFASSATAKVVDDATAQNPTFFSLWIGNNDVLGYATSGGTGVNRTGNPNVAAYGANDITDPTAFAGVYNTLVTNLTANGAKGVVANIPYVTSVPFFTTVKFNAATLSAAQAAALNSGYAPYNGGLQLAKNAGLITEQERVERTITFAAGPNALVIVDEYLTNLSGLSLPSYRQATAADYVLLSSGGVSAQAHLQAGNGTQFPLADKWVLSKGETAEVKTATDAYNATISSIATAKGLAFVDANAALVQVAGAGISNGGFTVTSAFVTGGGFSLDGVHPSPRGYALIANKFLQAINSKFGSNFKDVNFGNYRILFPANPANF
ncbi:G-D-S-L family lipolytic protein [Flavobacterium sp.]|uniref:SGNH/GDSL hydrolase family protein n=1 Tax=Flavobacterium sp. TaxID=239 RepID=UPI0026177677|nr:G-D-S-L family lipolytic protein [Flavobacterium sp.]